MVITELIQAYPIPSIIVISIGITLISSLLTKWLTNQEHLKSLKERQKELQKELKTCKDDCKRWGRRNKICQHCYKKLPIVLAGAEGWQKDSILNPF